MNGYINVLDNCVAGEDAAIEKMTEEDVFGQSFAEYIENVNECSLDDIHLDVNDIDTSVFIIDDGGELFRTKSGDYINVCWRGDSCRVWIEEDPEIISIYDSKLKNIVSEDLDDAEVEDHNFDDTEEDSWYKGIDDEGDRDFVEDEIEEDYSDDYKNERYQKLVGKKIRILHMDDPYAGKDYDGREGVIEYVATDPFGDVYFDGTWGSLSIYPKVDSFEYIDENVEEGLFNAEKEDINYGHKAWVLNQIISSMNDETAYYDTEWLYLWPDGETEKECDDDFGDEESFKELEDTFISIYKYNSADEDGTTPEEAEYNFHRDGLYNPTKEAIELAHEYDKKLGLEPIKVLGNVKECVDDVRFAESAEADNLETFDEEANLDEASDTDANIALDDFIDNGFPSEIEYEDLEAPVHEDADDYPSGYDYAHDRIIYTDVPARDGYINDYTFDLGLLDRNECYEYVAKFLNKDLNSITKEDIENIDVEKLEDFLYEQLFDRAKQEAIKDFENGNYDSEDVKWIEPEGPDWDSYYEDQWRARRDLGEE